MQSGTAAAHGIADGGDGLVLADDALVQFLLQVEQFLALALHHAGDGDARPAAHHLGNVVGGDLFTHQFAAGSGVQLLLHLRDVLLQFLQLAVAYLGYTGIVALAFGTFGLEPQLSPSAACPAESG